MTKNNDKINYGNAFEVLKAGLQKSDDRFKNKAEPENNGIMGAFTVLVAYAEKALELLAPDPSDIPNELFTQSKNTNP